MNDTGALTGDDLTRLRRAAAMAHTVGGLMLRVRAGGPSGRLAATVLPTVRSHAELLHPAGVVVDPCAFRMAVAKAWDDHRAGRTVALASAGWSRDGECDAPGIDVEWALASPGRLLGFGGVRTTCADRLVWALPSLLTPAELVDTLQTVDDAVDPTASLLHAVEARLIRDELLDVTVVYVEVEPTASTPLTPLLDEVIRRLVAASTASELVASLAA